MQVLATQSYSKIVREVTRLGKEEVEEARTMYLYPNQLVTKYHQFPIENILDMSFRKVGTSGGLLYVHTISGVFPYTVAASPEEFIRVFKEHCHRKYL